MRGVLRFWQRTNVCDIIHQYAFQNWSAFAGFLETSLITREDCSIVHSYYTWISLNCIHFFTVDRSSVRKIDILFISTSFISVW